MAWPDRLKSKIVMTSPLGVVFEAFWVGDSKDTERKIGLFDFPDIQGTFVQDFQSKGSVYTTPIVFAGPDNDLDAVKFDRALKEKTQKNKSIWTVIHPVKGVLKLQPLGYSENINPIISGNITQFDIQWIEAKEDTKQPLSLVAGIRAGVVLINSQIAEDFDRNIVFDLSAEKEVFKNNFIRFSDFVHSSLRTLIEKSSAINSKINSILRGIDSSLSATTIDLFALSAQLRELIQLPATIEEGVFTKYNNYRDMIIAAFTLLDIDISKDGVIDSKNISSIKEHVITTSLAAIAEIILSGEIDSRIETIELIDGITELYDDSIDNLEETQQLFIPFLANDQYFSQIFSFGDLLDNMSSLFTYLINNIFSKSVEKRFLLEGPRAPVDIVITELGDLGEGDEKLDEFISINKLSGNDILLIQDNREVVIYV